MEKAKYKVNNHYNRIIIYNSGWWELILHEGQVQRSAKTKDHMIAHTTFYYNNLICHRTYAVLIRIHITCFTYLKHQKGR